MTVTTKRAKRVIHSFLITLGLLIIFQFVLNYALNPTGYFRSDGLLRHDVTNSNAYIKLAMIDAFVKSHHGESVVISVGSSRITMLSNQGRFTSKPYFNAGLPGGQAEDIYAIIRYLISHTTIDLEAVFINIDPGVLRSDNQRSVAYGARLEGVYELTTQISDRNSTKARLRNTIGALLGPDWIIAITDIVYSKTSPTTKFEFSTGVQSDDMYVNRIERSQNNRQLAKRNHLDRVIADAPNVQLDQQRIFDIHETVSMLTERGTVVTLFIPTYEPTLWSALLLDTNYQARLFEIRTLLSVLSDNPLVIICDLADPFANGMFEDRYWFDGYHFTVDGDRVIGERLRDCVSQHPWSSDSRQIMSRVVD